MLIQVVNQLEKQPKDSLPKEDLGTLINQVGLQKIATRSDHQEVFPPKY